MRLRKDIQVMPKVVRPEQMPTPRKLLPKTPSKQERKHLVQQAITDTEALPGVVQPWVLNTVRQWVIIFDQYFTKSSEPFLSGEKHSCHPPTCVHKYQPHKYQPVATSDPNMLMYYPWVLQFYSHTVGKLVANILALYDTTDDNFWVFVTCMQGSN